MSEQNAGPTLNATGTDPIVAPPPPPPLNASNHPSDRTAGASAEIDTIGLRALDDARTGQVTTLDPAAPAATDPAPTDPVKPAQPKTTDADPTDVVNKDDTPAWMKAEVTKERNRRRAAEEAATAAQKRLDEALESIKALTPKPAPEPIEVPRPRRENYDTPEAYDSAVDIWAAQAAELRADKAAQEAKAEAARQQEMESQQRQLETLRQTWEQKRTAAQEKYADYVTVVENPDLTITEIMAGTAVQIDNGADVLYHLGTNPELASKIAGLPPIQQALEIGLLSGKLAQRPQTQVSRAPAPITPLSSTREPVTDLNREETMEEVAQRVARTQAAGRGGFWGGGRA